MPKVIISDKASYTLMLSPPRWRKPTHQYLLNYYNIIKQKIPQPSQGGSKLGDVLPIGTILPYAGNLANIPDGWTLCDGNNGTPNLKDRFIVGAGGSYNLGVNGGENFHILTINEMARHNHQPGTLSLSGGFNTQAPTVRTWGCFRNTNTGGSHHMGVNVDGGLWNSGVEFYANGWQGEMSYAGLNVGHENRPPFYAVYYIMKVK